MTEKLYRRNFSKFTNGTRKSTLCNTSVVTAYSFPNTTKCHTSILLEVTGGFLADSSRGLSLERDQLTKEPYFRSIAFNSKLSYFQILSDSDLPSRLHKTMEIRRLTWIAVLFHLNGNPFTPSPEVWTNLADSTLMGILKLEVFKQVEDDHSTEVLNS